MGSGDGQHVRTSVDAEQVTTVLSHLDDEATIGGGFGMPRRIGRYDVHARLGEGGMGVVYAAFDHDLSRRVAVKVLRERGGPRWAAQAKSRLLREARTLARVSHPNVVALFDVGTFETPCELGTLEQLYLAMELVEGRTLRVWQTDRSVDEILAMYIDAGRGLAAAHAEGVVHRDFKPDNVLVDEHGRACVLDFGLAVAERELPPVELEQTLEVGPDPAGERLTMSGTVMSTPAYMAPEQLRGQAADARSDQFAFCVALFEALYGQRPFGGRSVRQLRAAIVDGIRWPEGRDDVPRSIRRALARGLSPDPRRRFAAVPALLDALQSGAAPGRLRALSWLGGVGLSVAGSLALLSPADATERTCTGFSAEADMHWGAERRDQVRAAFVATKLPYARDAWTRVDDSLTAYADHWASARRTVCEADRQLPVEVSDLQIRCLDARLNVMDALVDVFAQADDAVVLRASRAVASLPRLSECADVDVLQSGVLVPATAGAPPRLQRTLDEVAALEVAGRYARALPLAQSVVDEAVALGHRPLEAHARRQLGALQEKLGDFEAAEREMSQAAWLAVAVEDDRFAARTMTELTGLVGYYQARTDDGLAWSRHAEAALARTNPTSLDTSRLTTSIAAIHFRSGDYPAAAHHYALALEQIGDVGGDDELRQELANIHNNFGNSLSQLGEPARAHEHLQTAYELTAQLRGQAHPDLAVMLGNLANVELDLGRRDQAQAMHQRALQIRREAFGDEHPLTASSWMNLGVVLDARGRHEQARAHLQRALAIKERVTGPEHPDTALALNNLGETLRKLGDIEGAAIHHRRALQIWEETLGPHHPYTAYPATNLGQDFLAAGDYGRARDYFEHALHTRLHAQVDPALVAIAKLGLARAREALGEPPTQTRRMAAEARAVLAAASHRYDATWAELEGWSREDSE